jgi:uncharacterized protein (TIGR00255 family)
MTGFGAAGGKVQGIEYAVEIRSVNNRYFKAVLKLPEHFSQLESDIEKLVRSKLSRGTLTVVVRVRLPDELAAYKVNSAALQNYIEELKPLEIDANPALRIDLGSLLQLPGVCEPQPLDDVIEKSRDGLMALVDRALAEVVEMRRAEGRALEDDLLARCGEIEAGLKIVGDRSPLVVQDYQKRLAARVKELTDAGQVSIDEEYLAREVAVFAERCDIAEEVSRLRGHLDQFRCAVDSAEAGGRKLEFIAQEMLREANTIASKANDSEIARAVVDIKTAVDRIKEQAQNVE